MFALSTWGNGIHLGDDDAELLRAAHAAGLTLVTYDQRTIPDLLTRLAIEEEPHGGVIFVNRRTLAQDDVSGLAKALVSLWEANHELDWINRISYLRRVEVE